MANTMNMSLAHALAGAGRGLHSDVEVASVTGHNRILTTSEPLLACTAPMDPPSLLDVDVGKFPSKARHLLSRRTHLLAPGRTHGLGLVHLPDGCYSKVGAAVEIFFRDVYLNVGLWAERSQIL